MKIIKRPISIRLGAWGQLFAVFSLLLAACSGARPLPEGQSLYTGAKVKLAREDRKHASDALMAELEAALVQPVPNRRVLWTRWGVWFHTHTRGWVRRKLGSTPVLLTGSLVESQEQVLLNRARNHGHFHPNVKADIRAKRRKRTAKVHYTLRLDGPAYQLGTLEWPNGSDPLETALRDAAGQAGLVKGKPYRLGDLRLARAQLAAALQRDGFYFLRAEDLLFRADTTERERRVDLFLTIKNEAPARARRRWYFGPIEVYPDYAALDKAGADSATWRREPLDGIHKTAIFKQLPVKKALLEKALLPLRYGDRYAPRAVENTFGRFSQLGVFRFSDIRLDPLPGSDSLLRVRILCTPFRPNNMEATGSGLFSPKVYTGVETELALTKRNTFGGAEALRLSGTGYWLQLNEATDAGFTGRFLDWIGKAALEIPRFSEQKRHTEGMSWWRGTAEYELGRIVFPQEDSLPRLSILYRNVRISGGYRWQNARRATWQAEFYPASGSFQQAILKPRPYQQAIEASFATDTTGELVALFAKQLAFTPFSLLTFDDRNFSAKPVKRYFRQQMRLKASGFLLPDSVLQALGSPYTFFLFSENDLRIFKKSNAKQEWAGRVAAKVGIPLTAGSRGKFGLGDLYAAGGANSLRAFAPRSIGAGSESAGGSADNPGSNLLLNIGNLSLEANLEYRHFWTPAWETAVFVDAGNVWLLGADASRPNADFRFNRFFREIALCTGAGLRWHFSFLVLRLDLGLALHRPDLPLGQRWTLPQFPRDWNLNFAFGYPF